MNKSIKILLMTILVGLLILRYTHQMYPKVNNDNKLKEVIIDKDYILALNSADQFLNAWLMKDKEKGSEFITDALKDKSRDAMLFAFFVVNHNEGFEITGGKRIDEKTIRFNVWLYKDINSDIITPVKKEEPFYVDVVKSDNNIWLVDNLPIFSELED